MGHLQGPLWLQIQGHLDLHAHPRPLLHQLTQFLKGACLGAWGHLQGPVWFHLHAPPRPLLHLTQFLKGTVYISWALVEDLQACRHMLGT